MVMSEETVHVTPEAAAPAPEHTTRTAPTTTPAAYPAADPAQRPARLALYLGVALVAVGFIAMYQGYNGTATNPLVQAQIPYVVSGGLVGLALVALGGVTVGVYVLLRVQADFRVELMAMREAIENLSESIAGRAAPSVADPGDDTVLVPRGGGSFHRRDCRLIDRAEHVRPLSRGGAEREGLLPCRICKP
ncbi:MAG TPA: hypothetical protein VGB83_04660 [Actinomycetota bacterium]